MDIIDVSSHQGVIDWSKVPAKIAVIRVGYRSGKDGLIKLDTMAERNFNGARKAGIKVGAYFWSQALTIEEAWAEADFACDHVGRLDLPIYLDSESSSDKMGRGDKLTREARTVTVVAFCTRVMERGYKPGVYSGQYWYKNNLDFSKLDKYHIWVARYSDQAPAYPPKWELWQYTSKGSVPGISGDVDLSKQFGEKSKLAKVILIGQASNGETGPRGQKPGNQTGKELNIREYYKHKLSWLVFRAPSTYVAGRICYAMLRAVKNMNIGYDQNNNQTLIIAAQKYGYDPGMVKIDVETDCARLVRVCLKYAGFDAPDFYTATEPDALRKLGFQEVTSSINLETGEGLQVGDILCTPVKGHSCVIVQA